jgi:hypothetical protein
MYLLVFIIKAIIAISIAYDSHDPFSNMKYRALLSDDDYECIRMPEKARVEDTEGKGLQ